MGTVLVVAFDSSRGIGRDGEIPWRIKGEMGWLSRFTKGTVDSNKRNALLMGRKTWDSLPKKPLPDRCHCVVSRNPPETVDFDDTFYFQTVSDAKYFIDNNDEIESTFIFGGSDIYAKALEDDIVDTLVITEIPGDYDCDVFFPSIPNKFNLVNQESIQLEDTLIVRKTYEKT